MTTAEFDDLTLLDAFESCTLDPAEFSHRRHLQVGWAFLQRDGFPQGALNFILALRKYVAHVGATTKYHETMTWAYLLLLNEQRELHSEPGERFATMIARRPDLLDHRNGALSAVYSHAQLEAPEARRVFLLPRIQSKRDVE